MQHDNSSRQHIRYCRGKPDNETHNCRDTHEDKRHLAAAKTYGHFIAKDTRRHAEKSENCRYRNGSNPVSITACITLSENQKSHHPGAQAEKLPIVEHIAQGIGH